MAIADVQVLSPRDVPTTLNYYAPPADGSLPYNYVSKPPAGVPRSNLLTDSRRVVVHDVRGKEESVGLDVTGFQFVRHESAETKFVDEERIQNVYYKEVEELLKREAGAKRVFIFDHTVRRGTGDPGAESDPNFRGPVERVHIDQTYEASIKRVHHHLPDDAERLLKGRVRIINVWRPIAYPVAHRPLAVGDWRTLDTQHALVSVRHIYPDREGSTFGVRFVSEPEGSELQWYYLSDQRPDEVTLIKCFDSDDSKARLTPHSAFRDESTPPHLPQRQSIEVRALVFDQE